MKILATVFIFITPITFNSEPFKARVTKVIDGNTIEIIDKEQEYYLIMLHGVDAPELQQDFGEEAKDFLTNRILEKNVTVEIIKKNRKGVRQAFVSLNRKDVGELILKNGLGWGTDEVSNPNLVTIAQNEGIGIWSLEDPTPPWIFVRTSSMKRAKGLGQ